MAYHYQCTYDTCPCKRYGAPEYEARFIGGPLGGEIKVMPDAQPRIMVPVMQSPRYDYSEAHRFSAQPIGYSYDTEKYRLDRSPTSSSAGAKGPKILLTYRWVNPTESLRKQNDTLKAQVSCLQSDVAVYKPKADVLSKLKSTLKEVLA